MRVNFLSFVYWGFLLTTNVICSNLSPVPVFMKRLQRESEQSLEGSQYLQNPANGFHALARSYIPSMVDTGLSSVTLHFRLPNDKWRQRAGLQLWIVLASRQRRRNAISINVLQNNNSTHEIEMTHHLRPGQLFVRFNITHIIPPSSSTDSLAVRIDSKNENGDMLSTNDSIVTSGVELGPLLVLAHKQLTGEDAVRLSSRRKRMLQNLSENADDTLLREIPGCRLQTWSVPVDDLGWEWLVYPYELSLNLCVGSCPMPLMHHNFNPTSHAIARNLFMTIHDSNRTRGHPDIQCVPITFRVMSLLLETEPGNYSLVTSDDLSASRCGCR